jgi:predicted ATPase/class 3 adenylate cyclase
MTMPALPSGTVTFLFTDIEGSTRLWERYPAEMATALAAHDALMRRAIDDNDGCVFGTAGDGFHAAFHTAASALTAACEAQLALSGESASGPVNLRVRMALHTGAAEIRDNDYFGPPLNRVARMLGTGHGGQVLLSRATYELVRDVLPTGSSLLDLGEHGMKDLVRPERVYQLVAAGLASEFPPLRSLDAHPHNLPIQTTSFVGRDRELQDVKNLLHAQPMVTLVGAGGAGKTRLALQAGAELVDEFEDGAWLVPLAPLTNSQLVPQSVAAALKVRERPDQAIADTLVDELRTRQLLLIIDNCEHVIDAAATFCDRILGSCPEIRILATSREALRVPGEATHRVTSLAIPDPGSTQTVSITQYAAVRLFVDRAMAAKSTFAVTNANAPAVASVCYHLDGIPLAIELAAARVRSMSVDEIDRRLGERFQLLTGGARTALPRHQTLRALIDWSHDLLNEPEKVLLRRLSVFSGGCAPAAASVVCSGGCVPTLDIPDLLAALADKSLLVADERNGETRFGSSESLREYAHNRLHEAQEEAEFRGRHAAYFDQLAKEQHPRYTFADQPAALARLETEHANLRGALAWYIGPGGDATSGMTMAGRLGWFWFVRSHYAEGRDWFSRFLDATPADSDLGARASALHGAATFAEQRGDFAGARRFFEESLACHRKLGEKRNVAVSLLSLGNVALSERATAESRDYYAQSLATFREVGDRQGVATALGNLANVAIEESDYATADALFRESLPIYRELNDDQGIANLLGNLGELSSRQGDFVTARARYRESLAHHLKLGARWGIATSLEVVASAESSLGEHVLAARLWGGATRLREAMSASLTKRQVDEHERNVASARLGLGDDGAFDAAWQQGNAMPLDRLVALALGEPVSQDDGSRI